MDEVIEFSIKYGVLPSEAMNIILSKEEQRKLIKQIKNK